MHQAADDSCFRSFFSFTSMHGCTLNYQLVVTVVMKNCEPLVSEPAFAIDKSPVHKSQVIFVHISIMTGGNHLFHSEKEKKEGGKEGVVLFVYLGQYASA